MSLKDRLQNASTAPENRDESATAKKRRAPISVPSAVSSEDSFTRQEPPKAPRDARGRVLPGNNLNPGGRPKGLAAEFRELGELADTKGFILALALGEEISGHRPTLSMRYDAHKLILERGHGKAVEKVVNVDATPANGLVVDADTLDIDELTLFLKVARKQQQIAEIVEGDFTPSASALLPGAYPKADGGTDE